MANKQKPSQATKEVPTTDKLGAVVRGRVERALKDRTTKYRTQPNIDRSEGWVVRVALDEFLTRQGA